MQQLDLHALCKNAVVSALRNVLSRDPLRSLRGAANNLNDFKAQVVNEIRRAGYSPKVEVDLARTPPSVSVRMSGPAGDYTAIVTSGELVEALHLAKPTPRSDFGMGTNNVSDFPKAF
jgi:hypothetical protein